MANKTVYPYGTDGQLPSSIGVINDLRTGGADKALSAQQGVVIGEELFGQYVGAVTLTRSDRQTNVALLTSGAVVAGANNTVVDKWVGIKGKADYLVSGRVGNVTDSCLVCFYDNDDVFIAGSAAFPTTGAGTPYYEQKVTAPDNAYIMRVAGHTLENYPYAPAVKMDVYSGGLDKTVRELSEASFIKDKSYPFESGSIQGVSSGSLRYLESTARLRIDVPVKDVAAIRIVKSGWGIVAWAVYSGGIPTTNRAGDSYSAVSDRATALEIASYISSSSLSFTPERVIIAISKDDNTDISTTTSVDDIVQFDTLDRSLSGRDVVVLGDSSCDVTNRNCWAKVLQGRAVAMGIAGLFPGKGSTGWSTDITTPNVNGQWDNVKSGVTSLRPIIIITSGGNEIANLQLSYDETIALCKQTITTPANATEWAVYTLRSIIADKPMARIYLVSNFYASSTETKDEQRRTYREMLRALCDFFSITMIDLTRNSQIRGYLENASGSSGYHIYTPDGTHATNINGRYLIYSKIMGFVCREEKDNV